MVDTTGRLTGGAHWREGLRPALLGWLAARVAVACGLVLAHLVSDSVHLADGRLHLDQGLMTWDGTYYRVLAEGWYLGPGVPGDAVRFFPLFPGLGRVLSLNGAISVDIPLLVLANVAAIAAAVVVWQLAADHTRSTDVANRAAWITAIIPAANVYAFAYSESLMLLLTAAALLFLARRRLLAVAGLGLLAGMLRPSGVLLAIPVAITAWGDLRSHDSATGDTATRARAAQLLRWSAPLLAPAVGLVAALAWINLSSGDFAAPMRIQQELRDGFRDPVTRIGQAFIDFAGGHLHDVYNVAFALGFGALIVVAWRKAQPLAWIAYMCATWAVAVGGNNMDSVGRYCAVAAPFAIALAQWSDRTWRIRATWVLGLGGTVWFTTEVMLGRIIP